MNNRDIKFRAWNPITKRMSTSTIGLHNAFCFIPACLMMEFTGLKDSNGVEIYEGDIIKYTSHDGYLLPDFIAEICYANEYASFGFQVNGDPARWKAFAEFDEVQRDVLDYVCVIGNIYENLELFNNDKINKHESWYQ